MKNLNQYNLLIAGDIMPAPHNMALFENGDIEVLFGDELIKVFKKADYSIANLEGCLTDTNEYKLKPGPVIKATSNSINAISKLGLRAVALANNHVTDANQRGVLDTLKVLRNSGICYVGVGTQSNMKSHIVLQINNERKLCIYNVSETFFNEPDENNIGANIYDEYLVCKEIESLKNRYDYVFVIFHAGSEYFKYPTPDVKRKCHRMVESGADLITTQHTHCIGCEEYYKGSYILYGQGNFCFGLHKSKERQTFTQKGLLIQITFLENKFVVSKIMTSLHHNSVVRLDSLPDFDEFYKRSEEVKRGKDFSMELTECKTQEIALKYIKSYKGENFFYKVLRKLFPDFYKKLIMKYSRKELLNIYATLVCSRRNEEMALIFKQLIKQS